MPRKTPYYNLTPDGCWEWQGSTNNDGYGLYHMGKYSVSAHRLYYELIRGPIAEGMVIDHVCGNRLCVNPHHMEVVSQAENVRRGKAARLTADQVAEIRKAVADGETQRTVADRYGVSQPCVSYIVRGINWSPKPAPHLGTVPSGCGSRDRRKAGVA